MGIFDSLQLKKRLESAAGDVGKSIVAGLTPKSPVPLSTAGLEKAATDKAKKTAADGEVKAKSKVKDLEKATVGKVGAAIQGKIDSTAARADAAFDGTLAKAEGKVDAGIAKVGDTVDKGIAGIDKKLDAAEKKATSFVSGKKKPAAEPAAAAEAPAADAVEEKSAPDDAGITPVVIGRKRPKAVTAAPAKADEPAAADKVETAADKVETTADKVDEKTDDDDIIPSWFFADDSEEKFAAMDTAEPRVDPYADDDVDTDLEGAATAEADERKKAAGGTNEVEITEEDAAEFDEDDTPGGEDEKLDEGPEADLDGEIEQIADEHKGHDGLAAKKRELRKKLTELDNKLAASLGGGLATAKSKGSKDPWLAFFVASTTFAKKLEVRRFKDDLEGKKEDEQEKAANDAAKNGSDGATDTVDEKQDQQTAELPRDQTEVDITGGVLRRSDDSPENAGGPVDTTSEKTGSAGGKQVYAVDKTNKIHMSYEVLGKFQQSRLLGSDDMLLGGEIQVKNGVITWLSNDMRGDKEDRDVLVGFLKALREQGVKNDFDVYEASKKAETTADDLLAEAEQAEPEAAETDLVAAMAKNDKWKTIASDFGEKAILAVAQEQKWQLVSGDVVDAAGEAVDPATARELLQKHMSKANAAEAAALVAAKQKAEAASAGAAVGG